MLVIRRLIVVGILISSAVNVAVTQVKLTHLWTKSLPVGTVSISQDGSVVSVLNADSLFLVRTDSGNALRSLSVVIDSNTKILNIQPMNLGIGRCVVFAKKTDSIGCYAIGYTQSMSVKRLHWGPNIVIGSLFYATRSNSLLSSRIVHGVSSGGSWSWEYKVGETSLLQLSGDSLSLIGQFEAQPNTFQLFANGNGFAQIEHIDRAREHSGHGTGKNWDRSYRGIVSFDGSTGTSRVWGQTTAGSLFWDGSTIALDGHLFPTRGATPPTPVSNPVSNSSKSVVLPRDYCVFLGQNGDSIPIVSQISGKIIQWLKLQTRPMSWFYSIDRSMWVVQNMDKTYSAYRMNFDSLLGQKMVVSSLTLPTQVQKTTYESSNFSVSVVPFLDSISYNWRFSDSVSKTGSVITRSDTVPVPMQNLSLVVANKVGDTLRIARDSVYEILPLPSSTVWHSKPSIEGLRVLPSNLTEEPFSYANDTLFRTIKNFWGSPKVHIVATYKLPRYIKSILGRTLDSQLGELAICEDVNDTNYRGRSLLFSEVPLHRISLRRFPLDQDSTFGMVASFHPQKDWLRSFFDDSTAIPRHSGRFFNELNWNLTKPILGQVVKTGSGGLALPLSLRTFFGYRHTQVLDGDYLYTVCCEEVECTRGELALSVPNTSAMIQIQKPIVKDTNGIRFVDPESNRAVYAVSCLGGGHFIVSSEANADETVSRGPQWMWIRKSSDLSAVYGYQHTFTKMETLRDSLHILTSEGVLNPLSNNWKKKFDLSRFADANDSIKVLDWKLHPNGRHVIAIIDDSRKEPEVSSGIFDIERGEWVFTYLTLYRKPTQLAVNPDGTSFVIADDFGRLTCLAIPASLQQLSFVTPPDFYSFLGNSLKATVSDTIHFFNLTLPEHKIQWYKWSFGDGSDSDERSPNHQYKKTGRYDVRLTVQFFDGTSQTETKPQYITVSEPSDVYTEEENTAHASPNPARYSTTLTLNPSTTEVRIFDLSGRLLVTLPTTQNRVTASVTISRYITGGELPSGVYFFRSDAGDSGSFVFDGD